MHYYVNLNLKAFGIIGDNNIDIVDASIFDYIERICRSESQRIIRTFLDKNPDVKYTWVDYKTLCREMPMLKINSSSPIQKRTTKLAEYGLIEKLVHKKTMTCFRVLKKADFLDIQSYDEGFYYKCNGCRKRCEDCKDFEEIMKHCKK